MNPIYLGLFLFCFSLYGWADTAAHVATSSQGMVVSEHYLATQVGSNILKQGGNAIDAAVAVGYALAVVDPCCGNLGGGGFMTIHLANGRNVFLNFRETAPLAAKPDMFLDESGNIIPNKSLLGYAAVGVPGTVLGLETARQRYGHLPRQAIMSPAIELAKNGFTLLPEDIKRLYRSISEFQQQPNVAAIFLPNGKALQAGDKFIQKDLANTLNQILQKGTASFYRGDIARKIVDASEKNGGILTMRDFAHYQVQMLKPITCTYHDYQIISAPPPSSGGVTLCESLNILEGYPLSQYGYQSILGTHYLIEAMGFSFADRNVDLGDPNFVNNPLQHLLSKKYAAEIRRRISNTHAFQPADPSQQLPRQSLETTHYSVVDKAGNAVSVTYTLDRYFGAGVIAGDTGFFLNDEMDDFTSKEGATNQFGLQQGKANRIEPGKRPLSSMTPTIILKDHKVFLVLGSPGGPRIITSVLQTFINLVDYRLSLQQAVDSGRIHYQDWPNVVDYETNALPENLMKPLISMGYQFRLQNDWGAVAVIQYNAQQKNWVGVMDKRRPLGAALGI